MDAAAVFLRQVGDADADGFKDPQVAQTEHRDWGEVVGLAKARPTALPRTTVVTTRAWVLRAQIGASDMVSG
ncbi:hypothetical protein [Actinomadura sp. 3N508]|uniref:hypothetical protein n=1 Tax=Actinomadura sp. 3N508 TaxID=3375153 RepID=UPI0037BB3814